MTKLMSKKTLYTAIMNRETITDEMVAKAEECLKALETASAKAKTRTPSATSKEGQKIAENQRLIAEVGELIVNYSSDHSLSASELVALNIEGITNASKASYVLRELVKSGVAQSADGKGHKVYFKA